MKHEQAFTQSKSEPGVQNRSAAAGTGRALGLSAKRLGGASIGTPQTPRRCCAGAFAGFWRELFRAALIRLRDIEAAPRSYLAPTALPKRLRRGEGQSRGEILLRSMRLESRPNPQTGMSALRSAGFPACGLTGLSSPVSRTVSRCARREESPEFPFLHAECDYSPTA
jgi:hypothetical protein